MLVDNDVNTLAVVGAALRPRPRRRGLHHAHDRPRRRARHRRERRHLPRLRRRRRRVRARDGRRGRPGLLVRQARLPRGGRRRPGAASRGARAEALSSRRRGSDRLRALADAGDAGAREIYADAGERARPRGRRARQRPQPEARPRQRRGNGGVGHYEEAFEHEPAGARLPAASWGHCRGRSVGRREVGGRCRALVLRSDVHRRSSTARQTSLRCEPGSRADSQAAEVVA